MARKFFRVGWVVAVTVFLTVLLPLASWAGSADPPLMVKKPPILDTFPEVFDPELDTMRGCHGVYYFGLDLILNCNGTGPLFTLTPHPHMPEGTVITPTGLSYQDAEVTYRAGLGRHSLYQAVQVRGANNIVTGVVNLDLIIPQTMFTGRPYLGLPKGSLIGLTH